MKEGEDKNEALSKTDFINRYFTPNDSYFENSRKVDLTFGVIVDGKETRKHIVRVELEMKVAGKFVKYGEPNVIDSNVETSSSEIETDRVVGYRSNGEKVILYDNEQSPVEMLEGYHNGNARTYLHNALVKIFPFLNNKPH